MRTPAVRPGPHRQPRRDRGPDHPGLPRTRDGGRRRLQRRRRGRAARADGRRRHPHRSAAAVRELPADRPDHRGRPGDRRRGDPPGVRLPGRASGVRPGRRGGGDRLRRPVVRRHRCARRQAPCPPPGHGRSAWIRCRGRSIRRPSIGPMRVAGIVAEAEAIGFPLLVKAAAGGGGRGMRRVVERPGSAGRPDGGVGRGAVGVRRRRRSTWSGRSAPRATSRSSCWATRRDESSRSASATARSSGATRSSSRRRRRPA